jgi:hypothetical protein
MHPSSRGTQPLHVPRLHAPPRQPLDIEALELSDRCWVKVDPFLKKNHSMWWVQSHGLAHIRFWCVHTPILTTIDCEGAGARCFRSLPCSASEIRIARWTLFFFLSCHTIYNQFQSL